MGKIRSLPTLGATVAAIGALIVGVFAAQDLWLYGQAVANGWTEWARSGQGLWQLTCGVAETTAVVILIVAAAKFLGAERGVAA